MTLLLTKEKDIRIDVDKVRSLHVSNMDSLATLPPTVSF